MIRKSKCLSLMVVLILLVLSVSGCERGVDAPEAGSISGRVVLTEDHAQGLTGVSLFILDGTGSYVETDAGGYFETTAPSGTVIIPRKVGYTFFPEKQVLEEGRELTFAAQAWPEPDFSQWGKQFAFDSHFDRVETVAFSADDQYIATGSSDRTIRIWRTSDGQLMGTIWGHTSVVKVISFSPQGDYLASATSNGEIKIWDWRTGWEIQSMHADTILLTDLAWSPDGGKLASSSWDGEVKVWDAVTGDELRTLTHEKWVRAVAWSPDGRFLFTGGDELSLTAWEVELGELSAEIPVRDKILSLSAAPQGSLVAMALGGGASKVLNVETGEEIFLEQFKAGETTFSWSADGRYLASGRDKLIQIWDMETQGLVQSINAGNYVLAVDWDSSAQRLVSGTYRGIIDLWSADSGENLRRIVGHNRYVKALAWSPEGDYLASGDEGGIIHIWDLQARRHLLQLSGHNSQPVEGMAWSPDGTYLASGGHDLLVRLWDPTGGEHPGALTERIKKPFVHEKGFEFAVGMKNVSHEDIVLSLSWAPDGMKLASASWDTTVAIWDVPTGTQVVGIQNPGWVTVVAWSPRGDQVAFGGRDQAVHVYSGDTGEEITKLEGHTDWVRSLAWSPDGKHLASSGYDRTVLIWDLETDQVVRTLAGAEDVVTVVEWSPCGRYLAGASHSGTVRIWDAATGEVLFVYPTWMVGLQALAWSPEGNQLAVAEYNSVVVLGEQGR